MLQMDSCAMVRQVTYFTLDPLVNIDKHRSLAMSDALSALIRFLRFGDAGSTSRFHMLDDHVEELFRNDIGRRVRSHLATTPNRVFFTRWQLLSAIKLVCTFGARGDGDGQVRPVRLLELLLMVNDFVHRDYGDSGPLDTVEQQIASVGGQALKGYSLLHHEPPMGLIGRYADILGSRAGAKNSKRFKSWLDINQVAQSTLGVRVSDLQAVLYAVYASLPNTVERRGSENVRVFPFLVEEDEQCLPFCFDPAGWFANTILPKDTVTKVLDLVTCSPDEIRAEHLTKYGTGVGRLFDVGLLLRKPIIKWSETRLAGLSRYLIVQRYTSGTYWDIHDALPDDSATKPNRGLFQTFFGELHEDYGRDVLRRITSSQNKSGKKALLIHEGDYSEGPGKNPDNLLVERIGQKNVRCTFFEFKVGRPRYAASMVSGDLSAFNEDLEKKIGGAITQEIDLCRRLQDKSRAVDGLLAQDVTRWVFVVVVTDPFPALGFLIDSLRERLSELPQQSGVKYHGPFILSLLDLEQLETLMPRRVSDLLIDWESGSFKDMPFGSFYWARTNGKPRRNEYVVDLGGVALVEAGAALFGSEKRLSNVTGGTGTAAF